MSNDEVEGKAPFPRRKVLAANRFTEISVKQVPTPVLGSTHCLKYSLAFVVDGVCVIRYDNERGKGDHKHIGPVETAYTFGSVATLIDDFLGRHEGLALRRAEWEQ